jgi:hypothetical protein
MGEHDVRVCGCLEQNQLIQQDGIMRFRSNKYIEDSLHFIGGY